MVVEGGTGGQRLRGDNYNCHPPPCVVKAVPATPLISKEGEGKKNLIWIRLPPAICTFCLFSQITCIVPPQPPLSCSVSLFSLPSRQVWAIHSDVRLTPSAFCCESEKDRERRRREGGREREKNGKHEKKKGRKQAGATAMREKI